MWRPQLVHRGERTTTGKPAFSWLALADVPSLPLCAQTSLKRDGTKSLHAEVCVQAPLRLRALPPLCP